MLLRCLFIATLLISISSFFLLDNKDTERARAYYDVGDYHNTVFYYQRAKKISDTSDIRKMAESLLLIENYDQASKWYRYLSKKTNNNSSTLKYINVLKINGEYNHAKEVFSTLETSIKNKNKLLEASLDSALLWLKQPTSIELKHLSFNTSYNEIAPMIYQDMLVFSSDREKMIIRKKDQTTHAPVFNLWVTNSGFKNATRWDMLINTVNHEGSCSFSVDYENIYFSRTSLSEDTKVCRPNLFYAQKNNLMWGNKKEFIFNNKESTFTHPYITPDESMLFFSSDLPGGSGGMDIYVCFNLDGVWTDPVNLGTPINTSGNELYPFLAKDGTLYFSSDTHLGMGGYDIFKAPQENKRFKTVENLKPPFNSSFNDFSFIIDSTNTTMFFSSNRIGGSGGNDIYSATTTSP